MEFYGLGGSGNTHRSYAVTVWFESRWVSVKDDNQVEKERYWCEAVDFSALKERLSNYFDLSANVRYVCCSQERCPSEHSGLLHGHLFLRLKEGVSGVKMLRDICGFARGQAWSEDVRKDFAAFEYSACVGHFAENQPKGKKPPLDFWEKGERPESQPLSNKKDFAACFALLQEGRPLLEVCAAYPEIAIKGFTNLQKLSDLIKGEKQNELQRKKLERVLAESHDSSIESGTQEETASDRTPKKTRVSPEFYARNAIEAESKAIPF